MSVIVCLAEMQQGSLLQELVKKKIDCATWPAGCCLFLWNLVEGLLNRKNLNLGAMNGWENLLL